MKKNKASKKIKEAISLYCEQNKKFNVLDFIAKNKQLIEDEFNYHTGKIIKNLDESSVFDQSDIAIEASNIIYEMISELSVGVKIQEGEFEQALMSIGLNDSEIVQSAIRGVSGNKKYLESILSATSIGQKKQDQQEYLKIITDYRKSPDARKGVKSRIQEHSSSYVYSTADVLKRFMDDYRSSAKGEMLVRLEKYVESGWFVKDDPLKAYRSEMSISYGDLDAAVEAIKKSMQERFLVAYNIREVEDVGDEGVPSRNTFRLKLTDNKIDSIFEVAESGVKDFFIRSADGKSVYVGDVTTDESGSVNKNSWLTGAKAALELSKSQGLDIKYSVSITSLFYDRNKSDIEIKGKFLNKVGNYDQKFIDDFHLAQYLTALSRSVVGVVVDGIDTIDIVNFTKVNFIGASSDDYVNGVLAMDMNSFVKESVAALARIYDTIKDRESSEKFDILNEHSTVEGVAVSVLLRATDGLMKLVSPFEGLSNLFYKELAPRLEAFESAISMDGDIAKIYNDLSVNIESMTVLRRRVLKIQSQVNLFESIREKKIQAQQRFEKLLDAGVSDGSIDNIGSYIDSLINIVRMCANLRESYDNYISVKTRIMDDESIESLGDCLSKICVANGVGSVIEFSSYFKDKVSYDDNRSLSGDLRKVVCGIGFDVNSCVDKSPVASVVGFIEKNEHVIEDVKSLLKDYKALLREDLEQLGQKNLGFLMRRLGVSDLSFAVEEVYKKNIETIISLDKESTNLSLIRKNILDSVNDVEVKNKKNKRRAM